MDDSVPFATVQSAIASEKWRKKYSEASLIFVRKK